ncbi:hypothetical protein B4589_010025 [Halolamina sp. CBA1230]|uniref:OapC/ArvC family zinc-ribbon domain-containing protein n=1 Tax=Halolamina sp. CBA1230 TaxID=1853690 RepID=UPI0009A1418D|nr:Zn-ribbon containing protein [Halolamina sp. CBA1230]QKY20698.1 hypothetical protein B4589_010025 [Halolamina sp. CBA1230]
MPHECTTCGRQFDDGSKEMLSGCPNCGGNKFQFQPAGRAATDDASATDAEPPEPADAEEPATGPETSASETPDPKPTASETADPKPTAADDAESGVAEREEAFRDAEIDDEVGEENRAQNDARSSSASIEEIDEARRKMEAAEEEVASGRGTPQGPPTETPSGEDTDEFDLSGAVGPDDDVEKQPVAGSAPEREEPVSDEDTDLRSLREELNDQFESIKITAPGQYELNLMELYDRKEYIISLQEDGRYVIEMADDYGIDE